MQAPTVTETPQIQAPESARPDQPRDDDHGFAKVLERSLAPTRRERPTSMAKDEQGPDKADASKLDAVKPDEPAKPAEIPPEAAALAAIPLATVLPLPASDGEQALILSGPVPAMTVPAATNAATMPVDTLPDTGAVLPPGAVPPTGPALPGSATDPASMMVPTVIAPTGPTTSTPLVSDPNADALLTPAAAATPIKQVTTGTDPLAAAEVASTNPDESQPLLAKAAPTPGAAAKSSSAADKLSDADIDLSGLTFDEDNTSALPVAPSPGHLPANALAAPVVTLATAPGGAQQATSTDAVTMAPTTAMPQPTTTPSAPPATAAGATLGSQTKPLANLDEESDEPDLQAKPASPITPPMSPAASTAPVLGDINEIREAAPTAPTQAPNPMERAVAQQVGRTMVQHLPNGERMMVLRLTPPELGTVRIEVIEHQGVLRARLSAEDDGVRLALERTLPQMRQELRASDAPIRELTLTDQSQFQRPDSQGQAQRQQDQQAERRQRTGEGFSLDVARSEPPAPPRVRDLGIRIDADGIDALA